MDYKSPVPVVIVSHATHDILERREAERAKAEKLKAETRKASTKKIIGAVNMSVFIAGLIFFFFTMSMSGYNGNGCEQWQKDVAIYYVLFALPVNIALFYITNTFPSLISEFDYRIYRIIFSIIIFVGVCITAAMLAFSPLSLLLIISPIPILMLVIAVLDLPLLYIIGIASWCKGK